MDLIFKPTYLYIKQHRKTKKLYFGKTTGNPEKYNGSGKYWTNHLNKHGKDVETLWYCLFYDKNVLVENAKLISNICNIVISDDWLNLKEENGLDGGSDGSYRIGKKHSEITILKMKKPKSNTINYFGKIPHNKNKIGIYKHSEEIKEKIRKSKIGNKSRIGMKNSPESIEKLRKNKLGLKKFINLKTGERKMFKPENVDLSIWKICKS